MKKKRDNEIKLSPSFFACEQTVCYCNWLLTLTSEGSEDGPITSSRFCWVSSSIDNMSTEALDGMCLQVRCSSTVFRVKKSPDNATSLASGSSASEKAELPTIFMANFNIGFEKSINEGMP